MICNENNKVYVGCTKFYDERQKQHMRYLRGGYHGNRYLLKDFQQGLSFRFETISLKETEEEASNEEIFWIKELDTTNSSVGYNLNSGGLNTNSGYKQSDYAKQVASEVHSKLTGERNSFYGKKHSEESKAKMSASLKGRRKGVKFSKEHKQSMRENNGKSKRISVDGREYLSITHASEETDIPRKRLALMAKDESTHNIYFL